MNTMYLRGSLTRVTDSRSKSWQSSRVYFVCNDVWDAAVGEGEYSGRRSKDSLFLRVSEIMSHCEIIYYVTSMGVTGVSYSELSGTIPMYRQHDSTNPQTQWRRCSMRQPAT